MVGAKGWDLSYTFEDNDVSASTVRGPGTAWAKMLAAVYAGGIDVVVSVDMDRLLRTVRDLVTLTEAGAGAKAKVLTVDG